MFDSLSNFIRWTEWVNFKFWTGASYSFDGFNKAISLGENPAMEDFYGFRAMVRDEGSNCLAYVQEADRTQFKQIIEERI